MPQRPPDPAVAELHLELPAEPAMAGEARAAVREFAATHGAVDATVADIALAVSEAVSNVVNHAYRDDDGTGQVLLEADREGDQIAVVVSDEGSGMTPRIDTPGLGLGLPMIASLADVLEVRVRPGGGTEVHMRFDLARAAAW
jgi:anti-sigma regulatory factor (Ser/Thr protein kinase)